MKKLLSLSFLVLMLSGSTSAMGSKDVDMSIEPVSADASSTFGMRELQTTVGESAFDMSGLQEEIDKIAYNGPISHLSYYDRSQDTDFVREMFKRYSALQCDLIQLQQTMPPEAFKQAFVELNKSMTLIISSEDMLKFTYLTVTHKFNSEQEITSEILTALMNYTKCITPDLNIPHEVPLGLQVVLKSIIYQAIKLNQEKREAFYGLLLAKPHLNCEYQAILSGEKSDLSEEFLHELITSLANCMKKIVCFSLELAAQNMQARLAAQNMQASVSHEEIESIAAQITSQITSQISAKRTVLPLLLKHFGEISGLGII